jgi:prepilin-type N-terminal cleavage/methylation domain-containing protein
MGRKNENGGFSLIELLVSIVILVVVAIPLLHSFYTVANTNTKSKRVLNATTAGQNLMEQIKSEALKDTMAGAVDEAGNTVTGLAENPAKIMKKTFEGISVNGQLYRADVTLDPTSYLGIINADGSLTSDDRDYNSTPIANLSNMSNETSAFYLMSEEDDTDAANDIDAENPDDTLADLKREISVEVSRNASAEITVKVQVYYNDELAKEQTVYAGKKGLENIFLLYPEYISFLLSVVQRKRKYNTAESGKYPIEIVSGPAADGQGPDCGTVFTGHGEGTGRGSGRYQQHRGFQSAGTGE